MAKPKAMQAFDILRVNESISLNGSEAPEELKTITLRNLMEIRSGCPFCNSPFDIHKNLEYDSGSFMVYLPNESDENEGEIKGYCLWYCRRCRFWQWYYYFDCGACFPEPQEVACISKLREFNDDFPEHCSDELAQYLRRNPTDWHKYEPKRLEKLVADIFRANYNNAEVIHVGKPDDGGVDVVFIDADGQQWLVQVKRRWQGKTEGISTIRNLIGAMILKEQIRGIIVSTVDHFSLRAQQAVEKAQRLGLHIKLVDKGILDRMLDPVLPDRPWLNAMKTIDPELAKWLSQKIPSDHQLRLF